MPKPYVPTGRPPGRPRNDSKPAVERLGIQDVPAMLKSTTQDLRFMPLAAICPDCFPDGWPTYVGGGPESANCQHGTWVKRL